LDYERQACRESLGLGHSRIAAEVFTEKKLGIKDRRDIGTKISLEDYIKTCRDNMVQTGNEWEETIDRIGRWVDFKAPIKLWTTITWSRSGGI